MPGPVLTEDPLLGLALGHYRLTEKIGSGGMGVVYRAHDEHLDREVAIKVLLPGSLGDETQRKHFRKEALALSKLNHPNIATIHDFDTQEGVDFLVMEYIPGISLSDAMGPAGLPENEVLRLGVQLAEALSAAHEQGVVHRDLKPGNLRLTGEGGLKILDFGLAKVLKPISEGTTTESALDRWAITGTLGYMAPEQVTGEKIDARTDIHAAGLVLYEMATGHRPFAEVEVSQLINAILHRTPPSPGNFNPRLSPELVRIIGKCLEKEPGNRYQSAKELAVDLRRLAAAEFPKTEEPAPPPTVVKRTWPRAATYTAIALLAAGLLLALNVGGLRERLLGGAKAEEGIRSVLALPSTVYAPKDDAFLAEAIPNTLSAQLTEVQGLETKMPPTSAEVERMGGDIGRIANAYGADALVLSSVMAQDGKLVVNLRLVEARNRRLRRASEHAYWVGCSSSAAIDSTSNASFSRAFATLTISCSASAYLFCSMPSRTPGTVFTSYPV
jgi:predicted Ser/Thr protein kinase